MAAGAAGLHVNAIIASNKSRRNSISLRKTLLSLFSSACRQLLYYSLSFQVFFISPLPCVLRGPSGISLPLYPQQAQKPHHGWKKNVSRIFNICTCVDYKVRVIYRLKRCSTVYENTPTCVISTEKNLGKGTALLADPYGRLGHAHGNEILARRVGLTSSEEIALAARLRAFAMMPNCPYHVAVFLLTNR